MKRVAATLVFALTLVAVGAQSRKLERYPLMISDPTAIRELLTAMLSPEAKVIHDRARSSLLILATPAEHAEIAPILKALNVPPRNVRVEVAFDESGSGSDSGAGITGSGKVVITPQGTGGSFKLEPHLRHQTERVNKRAVQTLVVQSGGRASLRVGEQVPYSEWLIQKGHHWGFVQEIVTMDEIGAFLSIEPIVTGNGEFVTVKLVPELRGLAEGKEKRIRYTTVATTVTVANGGTVSIGGLDENQEFYERFLFGVGRAETAKTLTIKLSAWVM